MLTPFETIGENVSAFTGRSLRNHREIYFLKYMSFFTNLIGTSPSSGLARAVCLHTEACHSTQHESILSHALCLFQLYIDITTFPKLPGGPVNVRERPGDSWLDIQP